MEVKRVLRQQREVSLKFQASEREEQETGWGQLAQGGQVQGREWSVVPDAAET